MKERFYKMREKLRSSKGETIMECIASLLILAILMVAVTTIIQASLKMTETSTVRAAAQQVTMSDIMLGDYSNPGSITFSNAAAGINVTHDVFFYNQDGTIAFTPQ
jgi:competence protein ComGC